VTRRTAWTAVAALSILPRLAVLLHEREAILARSEKSVILAQTFVDTGTFGFLPGQPSAYTQPLYGWFLIPLDWMFGGNWLAIGLAQILVAAATAVLVYEIGARVVSTRWALVAAAVATLHPYIVWHDVHVNREILDQLLAAALTLLTLVAAERRTVRPALLLGIVTGIAMLGNTRLVLIPVLCAAYVVIRRRTGAAALLAACVLGGAVVAIAPWVVRNKANVGCWAITTDGRALWKANNPQTYALLSSGQWIDNVRRNSPRPPTPGHLTPDEAHGIYVSRHKLLHPDECKEMRFYEHLAFAYVRKHPGDKAKLAALSEQLFWQPTVIETGGGSSGIGKQLIEPAYMWVLYALAALGLVFVSRWFLALALALFAYQSVWAALFVGATRYRIAFDFVLAILAAAALERLSERVRR
jgi:4-amino-4-deoxy-L-arabinose transferase-like glycosyltransferase